VLRFLSKSQNLMDLSHFWWKHISKSSFALYFLLRERKGFVK